MRKVESVGDVRSSRFDLMAARPKNNLVALRPHNLFRRPGRTDERERGNRRGAERENGMDGYGCPCACARARVEAQLLLKEIF